MFRLWRSYQSALHAHPVTTASLTAGTLMSAGDALAQLGVEKRSLKKYDVKRTLRFTVFGTFLAGPMFSVWYRMIARVFGGTKYASLKMVACDQLLFAPPFLAFFLAGMEVLKGEGILHIKNKLKDDYMDVMKTNYKDEIPNKTRPYRAIVSKVIEIWPAVQACNFTFVPVHNRIVVVNVVAVFWNTYLAMMSERYHEHPEEHLEKEEKSVPLH